MTIRSTLLHALLLGGLLGASLQIAAQTTEEPFVVGVCAHELHRGDPSGRAYAMMRDAGITSVRTDAHWAYVERQPNQLKIEPSWHRYLKETARHGLSTQFILGYGNQHHGGGEKPRTEPVRAAFNRYVNHLSEAFKGQVAYYEIWNEWDVEDPRDPRFTQDYARLIADAAGIVRQRDPAAKVLAGAVTTQGIESGFALRLLENGLMQSVDGLSLHPYVHCRGWRRNTPEAWIDWMAEVDKELTRAAGRPVPLYLTEMAWPSHQGACGIDEDPRAAYLARASFPARTWPTSATTVPTEPSASTTSAWSARTSRRSRPTACSPPSAISSPTTASSAATRTATVTWWRCVSPVVKTNCWWPGAPASRATWSSKRSTRNPAGWR